MKILYVADNINHHMIPLAESIISQLGKDNFRYAVLKPIEEFRVKMGFNIDDDVKPWVIKVYLNNENATEFKKWFEESDVVLFSSRTLFEEVRSRLKQNKLTFHFSERWWKPNIGKWRLLHPEYLKLALTFRALSKYPKLHYLAQGGYAAKDIQFFSKFNDRIWNFGYFTEIKSTPSISRDVNMISILWCGRMLDWKRVDVLVKAFREVIKNHPHCYLTLIGDGDEKDKLKILAKEILPDGSYIFLPSQSTNVIRQKMNSSDIFILPSSGYEGWGAVVNEAMSEACAVIASVESGAGKAIIEDGVNGFLFKSGDWKALSYKINKLIIDKKLRTQIQFNGQKSIKDVWSPNIAATRLITICDAILNDKEVIKFDKGPFLRYSDKKNTF
jgi:glycosyltransferase involved in cell wall biosynthesis